MSATDTARPLLPKPQFLSPSSSRRVRTKAAALHFLSLTTTAATNVLAQNIALTSRTFDHPAAAANSLTSTTPVSRGVETFLRRCRESGAPLHAAQLPVFFPSFHDNEFLSGPSEAFSGCNSNRHSANTQQQQRTGLTHQLSAHSHTRTLAATPLLPAQTVVAAHSHSTVLHPPWFERSTHDITLGYTDTHQLRSRAQRISAARLSLPARAAQVDILQFQDEDVARSYADPNNFLLPVHLRSPKRLQQAQRASMLASQSEYSAMIRRLVDNQQVELQRDKPAVINGGFAVPKADGSQRFIVDCTPANALFAEPAHVSLPTPDVLSALEAPPGQRTWRAGADLKDFYHHLRMPAAWRTYFGLPAVRPTDIGVEDQFPGVDLVWPVLRSLPMGFTHSVFLAQRWHLGFIKHRVASLPQSALIQPGADLRLDRLRFSIYVDDLTIFSPSPDLATAALDEYIAEALLTGNTVKDDKITRPTLEPGEVTGIQFDGSANTLTIAAPKLLRLCSTTMGLARAPVVSESELSSVLGKWAWCFLINRPLFSIFSSCYAWTRAHADAAAPLWTSAKLELAVACALAPMLMTNLSAAWFDRVVAVDASNIGQGVCAAQLPAPVISGLAASAGLAPADTADVDAAFDRSFQQAVADSNSRRVAQSSVLVNGIASIISSTRWSTIVSARWRRHEHINHLEMTAVRTALRWTRSQPRSRGHKLLILSDSAVSVFALAKGRTSSRSLLRQCRHTAAILLSSDLRLFCRWVPSSVNPADYASRAC